MNLEADFRKLFMNSCRMRKLNLYVQSCEALRRLIILDCKPTPDDLKKIDKAIKYIQKIPSTILEDLFSYFKSPNREYFTYYILRNMEAWHVALFIYEGQTQLIMDFLNADFDLTFVLDTCESKMSALEELKLPEQSQLSVNQCKRLVASVPHLQKLSLLAIDIANFAIHFIADLALHELELGGMILSKPVIQVTRDFVNPQIAVLCREDSIVRETLRILKIGDSANLESYFLILRSMPNLEYLDFSHGTWLTKLPVNMQTNVFNLKHLIFCNLCDQVENELDIARHCCPCVKTVDMTTNKFTRKMLTKLAGWKCLTSLDFKVVSSRYFNDNTSCTSSMPSSDKGDTLGLRFPSLSDFTIRDRRNFWLCNENNLINFLAICPQLLRLTFNECNGFDDKMAYQTSRVLSLSGKKVERIHAEFCNLLRPHGIRHFLAIPSLTECVVDLLLTHAEKRQFDVEMLEKEAKRMGKTLKIEITIRTIFHDLLSRLMF